MCLSPCDDTDDLEEEGTGYNAWQRCGGVGGNFSHQMEGAITAGVQVVHCTKHLAGVQMEAEIQPSSTRQARESGVRLWMPEKELFSNLC